MEHLCNSCTQNFAECNGRPEFGINRDPNLTGAAADCVESCKQHHRVITDDRLAELETHGPDIGVLMKAELRELIYAYRKMQGKF